MELLRRFSRDLDPYQRLTRVILKLETSAATAPLAQPQPAPPQPYKLRQRLSDTVIEQIIVAYQGGATTREVAALFHLAHSSVQSLLREHGVQARRKGLSAQETQRAVELYEVGETMRIIAEHLGFTVSSISRALAGAGVDLRGPLGR